MVKKALDKYHTVYLSLGSNIGDREKNIINALRLLKIKGIPITKMSSLYESEPVGIEDQPWFYNMVIKISSSLQPDKILKIVKDIEAEIGRMWTTKWGPRVIDIDILFYEDQIVNMENLVIPHKEFHNRDFVLVPMVEIEPDFIHPVLKKSIEDILESPRKRKKVIWVKFLGAV
ncbi:MAG: 2-amino-4-hydroxy-6-hydroxymethyldihydropteridine diphosphokinase [Spirochaetes bacterium]|nr:2-amino-4-hydroxy-6-hydroxymethyldihydropteridine diphosphokinase [Spirochaetota bacterium]